MKCVINKVTRSIRRVSNEKAKELVESKEYEYTRKAEWKKQGRKY